MRKDNWGYDGNGSIRVLIGVIFLILIISIVNIIVYCGK